MLSAPSYQPLLGAITVATALLALSPSNSNAQCPQNTITLLVFGGNVFVNSTSAAEDTFASSSQGFARGSYNLTTGFLTMYASGNSDADVSTHDVFTVSGLPAGTPVTFLAHLRVHGGIFTPAEDAFSRSASFEATIREGTSNSTTYRCSVSSRMPPYEIAVDSTLSVTISTLAGSPIDLYLNLHGHATHGGTSSFYFNGNGAQLSFSGLPQGTSIVSCQGFFYDYPIPVIPTTWGAIKNRVLENSGH